MTDVTNEVQVDTGAELAPGTDVGGYVIDAKIGEGGMGQVYGARHPRIGKRVAIKILARAYSADPAVVARFEQEARVVNEIKHPNIVDVFQFGELADKRSYFIMEWLDGEPLTARIDRGPIPAPEAMDILDVIADALAAAHEQNVIHRDLKSDNVYLVNVRGKRTVKLLDFGLAKLSGRGVEDKPVGSTKQGIVVGTPAYMSPEQARSQPVDGRTDVYALGCLAYKMLTGTLPFRGENAMDLIVQQLNAPPPHPIKLAPRTPPALSKLVVRMMAKAPDDRPSIPQIRELFAELRDLEAVPARPKRDTRPKKPIDAGRHEPTAGKARLSAASMAAIDVPPREESSNKLSLVALGILLLVAGVIGSILLIKKLQSDDSPPAAAAATGSAGSGSNVVVTVGSAEQVGSAGSAEQPMIEFEDDKVVRSGSGAGSAKRRRNEDAEIDRANEAEDAPVVAKPRPGKIFVMLQHASTIELDGKVVSQASQGGTFEVPPGDHSIKIVAPDRAPVTRTVHVEAGGSTVIRIADDTEAPTPPSPAPPAE